MDELMQILELDDAQFYTEVMRLGIDKTEVQHDREFLTRAYGLGIMATLPTVSKTDRLMSSAVSSDSTDSASRDQSFSTVSDGSTMTFPTPHSSIYGAPSPTLSSTDDNNNNVQKTQVKSLNFSPYNKYLAQADLLVQESPSRTCSRPPVSSGKSIFSLSTRRSISCFTAAFRNRIKLRRKPPRIHQAPMYVL
ncbi:hypothetical protein E4U41_003711 [Claviceps citrina]|nr:hypothetical protein E4U41_003711 [Claviceps citrina]